MAKTREIIGQDPERPGYVMVVRPVKDKETTKEARYSMLTFPAFMQRVADLNAERLVVGDEEKFANSESGEEAARYYNGYDYTLGVTESQKVREAAAAESTFITVDGEPRDLMLVPLAKLVKGINGILDAEGTGKEAPKAYHVARRKLLESNKVRLTDANDPESHIEMVPA